LTSKLYITPLNTWHLMEMQHRGFALSHDAPIGNSGRFWQEGERRSVSKRWLLGTVFTALTGGLLLGGTVYSSLEREHSERSAATLVAITQTQTTQPRFIERISNVTRKGDKLSPLAEAFVSAKQVIRVTSTQRIGDKETSRVRPYARVAVDLVRSSTDRAADVPTFNPIKLMAGDAAAPLETADETGGDITVSVKDINAVPLESATFIVANTREILNKVREVSQESQLTAVLNPVGSFRLPASNSNLFTTTLDKTPLEREISALDKTLIAKDGDTVVSLLLEAGANRDEARAIAAVYNRIGQDLTLKAGNRMRLLFAGNKEGVVQPIRSILNVGKGDISIVLADDGKYVQLDSKTTIAAAKAATEEEDENEGGFKLYNAIYETGLKQEIPKKVIEEMIRIFTYDTDFNKAVVEGDRLEVFYATEDDMERGDVLYASLTSDEETRKYYRYQTPDDNSVDYYDENGKSAKKFLIRKPVADGVFRSPFGTRRHPILGYSRPHNGVDWSARTGTAIVAAGNGTVDFADWSSGYGRRIEIQHANGYKTTYSHQSRFAKGMKEGVRVTQGQIIGYVGNTGLSTGPHLHYEVSVNDRYVDPLRVRVPQGRELNGAVLAEFKKERAKIDNFIKGGTKSAGL
jgi:murein DD-endopeptidase MepM/ murein hydrolase activator NlpD